MNKKSFSPLFMITGSIIVSFLIVAILAPILAPFSPEEVDRTKILLSPSSTHVLGTDSLGRDVWSRLIYGARISVFYALAGALSTMLFGASLGVISGYYGGWIDRIIQVFVHIFQGLPGMSLMIAIAGVLGPSPMSILLAVTLTSWTTFSRIVRGEVMRIKLEDYVMAGKVLGANHWHIMRYYLIPNIMPTLIVLWTVRIGTVLLAVAALSFLGLGVQPPQADWGGMVHDAKVYFRSYPWLLLAPGCCIALLSISIQLWGDELRSHLSVERDEVVEDM